MACSAIGVRSLGSSPEGAVDIRAAEIVMDVAKLGIEKALGPVAPRGFTDPLVNMGERDGWIWHASGQASYDDPDDRSGWLARQIYPYDAPHLEHDVGVDDWDRMLIAQVCRTHSVEIHCTHEGCAATIMGPLLEEWMADPDTGDVLCPQHRQQAVWLEAVVAVEFEVSTDIADRNKDLGRPPPSADFAAVVALVQGIAS
jgi:hypothetical protein